MKKFLTTVAISTLLFAGGASLALACTDVRIISQDNTVVIARSMEFAADLHSNLMTSPQQRSFTNVALNGKPAMAWKSKYGYVFLDGLETGFAIDGMNEQGLAVEALYLPGETEYQTVPDGKEANAIPYLHFGDWILGNFKTIDEVRIALANVYVFAQTIPQAKEMIFPLHFSIYEPSGKGIVVEFIGGNMKVHDNDIGVMTNSPTYDWHITNLRNYVNMTPYAPKPVMDDKLEFVATGQGAGMVGLPGDVSPPSRFVKMAVMSKTILQPKDAAEALNMGEHLLNNVDIPLGFVREVGQPQAASNELTQWVVFKDLTNKVFNFRTYDNMTLRSVDLTKLDFSPNASQLRMPIESSHYVMDLTAQFLKTTTK